MTKNNTKQKAPVFVPHDVWVNSQFSLVRAYGYCKINGRIYEVVGERQDLVLSELKTFYISLGYKKFIEVLQSNPDIQSRKDFQTALRQLEHPKVIDKSNDIQTTLDI